MSFICMSWKYGTQYPNHPAGPTPVILIDKNNKNSNNKNSNNDNNDHDCDGDDYRIEKDINNNNNNVNERERKENILSPDKSNGGSSNNRSVDGANGIIAIQNSTIIGNSDLKRTNNVVNQSINYNPADSDVILINNKFLDITNKCTNRCINYY